MKTQEENICSRCVMDTSAKDIFFNAKNECNYCAEFSKELSVQGPKETTFKSLEKFVAKVKKDGQGKKYDCIVGVSGGVDSSWVLYRTKQLGLRALAVHMDNGWNSELAQNNIEGLVRHLGVDLHTHVINWLEYRGFMQAFFDADVIDVPEAALPAIDALLRLVAGRLLADEDTTRASVDTAAAVAARSVPVVPAHAAMAYLRDRVGVPRDADHPVAHEMRCGLNWMCKVLL